MSRETTREYWSRQAEAPDAFSPLVYWLAVPEVMRRVTGRAVGGAPYGSWAEWCVRKHLGARVPVEKALSIGCGSGGLERELAALGTFRSCTGFDLAPAAIEIARRDAARAGIASIDYVVGDAEHWPFAASTYEAVWFNGSLHHIRELDLVLSRVSSALKPGGWLFLNEYVGASRFAFGPRQVQAMRAAFLLIPPDLRRSFVTGQAGPVLEAFPLPDPLEVAAADPSEAVNSDQILPALLRHFRIVERNDTGGTLLQFLLAGIAGNFRTDDPRSMAVLDMLFRIEDALLAAGDLPSDFTVIAAQPLRT